MATVPDDASSPEERVTIRLVGALVQNVATQVTGLAEVAELRHREITRQLKMVEELPLIVARHDARITALEANAAQVPVVTAALVDQASALRGLREEVALDKATKKAEKEALEADTKQRREALEEKEETADRRFSRSTVGISTAIGTGGFILAILAAFGHIG